LEAVVVDGAASALAGGFDGVALFVVGGVYAHGGAVSDGVADVVPEVVADAGGDGADVEPGCGFGEPAGEGAADVVGHGGGGDDDEVGHGLVLRGRGVVDAGVDGAEVGVPEVDEVDVVGRRVVVGSGGGV